MRRLADDLTIIVEGTPGVPSSVLKAIADSVKEK
jgi:hypothetical protein